MSAAPAPVVAPTLRAGAKGRILSGMRPTGKLHLGNYVGALQNWVALQDEFENFHMVADWHALTTAPEAAATIQENTYEMVLDWLAAGIDPAKSPVFVQSHVKEHAERRGARGLRHETPGSQGGSDVHEALLPQVYRRRVGR
jgi:hypothetical protein